EAIAGASSANNAGIASAYVPTLAFGIPGDTITAILIGVLLVKGITPGPDLFLYQTDTLYAIYIIFIVANLLLLPLGFLLIRVSGFVLRIPRSVLMGLLVAISICGAFDQQRLPRGGPDGRVRCAGLPVREGRDPAGAGGAGDR